MNVEPILILRVLLRRWWLIIIPVAIASALIVPDFLDDGPAVNGGFNTVIRYTAAQEADAVPERDGDLQDLWLASELTVNAFTEWVRTSRFKDEVALITATNGLEINPLALRIGADNQRSIGQVFINWHDETELRIIADAVIVVMQTRNQAYFPQLGGQPAIVEILDDPQIAPAPPPLTDRFGGILKLAIALIAGIGLAFLVEYLDPTLRTQEDLETLGLKVIVSIPKK
jgi:capsular polysaccharide biosynthesis protein